MSQEVNPGAHSGVTWGVSLKSCNHPELLSLRGAGPVIKLILILVLSMCQTLVSQSFTRIN